VGEKLLGDDTVVAITFLRFGRDDTQAHLLFDRAAQEAAHRMSLPAGGLAQLLERSAVGTLEKRQDLGCLGAPLGWGVSACPRLGARFGLVSDIAGEAVRSEGFIVFFLSRQAAAVMTLIPRLATLCKGNTCVFRDLNEETAMPCESVVGGQ